MFVRVGTTWTQQAYLKASNTQLDDEFGKSVAISGDTIVIGAPEEDSNATGINGNQSNNSSDGAGAAYVFVRQGTTWTQQAYLKASNTGVGDAFGDRVAISGDTIVVAAFEEDSGSTGVNGNEGNDSAGNSGAAYVFVRSGSTWTQQAYLKASNTGAGDLFGDSVAISNDTIVLGAPQEASSSVGVDGDGSDNGAASSGAAYVFLRTGTTWTQQAYLKASNTGDGDQFGNSVTVEGDTIAVGAPDEDSNATGVNGNQGSNTAGDAGATYIYVRNAGTWSQQAYIKASNTDAGDQFGWAVSVLGDTLGICARLEDGNATIVNGDDTNNTLMDSGAAYVFVRNGTTWSQQSYVKASNSDPNDRFGYSIGISEDGTVVVGALFEASNAKGVNGDSANNSSFESGAVYVYTASGTVNFILQKGSLTDSDSPGKDQFKATAKFAFNASSPDSVFNPQTDQLQLSVGPDTGLLNITIPAADAGWKQSPATLPTKFTWKSANGITPKVQVVIDTKKSTIDVKVSNMDWPVPPANPIGFAFEMGNDSGPAFSGWSSKTAGKFKTP
ncbi:MAG: FG-GAP repeat protein [Planctomycetota bacterium]